MTQRPPGEDRVIMFADIVGSTRVYESLGDTAANALLRERLELLKRVAAEQGGETVAEIGDEIMCIFERASGAAHAACEMHAELARLPEDDLPVVRLRIGMHQGPLAGSSDDLIGETAKIAQWATRHAKPEQTLITRNVHEALPRLFKAVSRFVDDETWDSLETDHLELHELIWDVEAITVHKEETMPSPANRFSHVDVLCGERHFVLNTVHPVLSIGRHAANDIVINHELVSRQHATLQFSRGRCTLSDNSTNGTFIITSSQTRVPVRRETFPLDKSGTIYLGEPGPEKEPFALTFICYPETGDADD
ncbi:MAG: adenylate/guanylate cyclase domain-containing protein [Gammaproteobacteria bacterium]|nr:adenylate/guanylate cyclase domain-containing protein [Gammaproteobacteria bacterium]